MDNEMTGKTGSHLNYKYRVHDARLGRFLSIDPLAKSYPWNSTYAFSENSTIAFIELEGLEKARAKYNYSEGYYYDEATPDAVSCLVTPKKNLLGQDQIPGTYDPSYIVPTEVKVLSMAPFAAMGGVLGGGFIAAEAALLSGVSWSTLPIAQSFAAGAGAWSLKSSLIAGGSDFFGQYASNLLATDFDFSASFRTVNFTSTLFTATNPSSKIYNLALNGIISNTFQVTPEGGTFGSPMDVMTGTMAEISFGMAGGKLGDGQIQRSLDLRSQFPALYSKHFSSLNSPEMSKYLYDNGTDAFLKRSQEMLDEVLKLEIKTNISTSITFQSISTGTQTFKNSTLKIDD